MDSEKRTEIRHELELCHQKTCHETDLVVKDEESRRLRLDRLLAKDETATVRDALSQKTSQLDACTAGHAATRTQLQQTASAHAAQVATTRAQTRQLGALQAERAELEAAAQDAAGLLAEKLALAREVTLLRPQLDHARSQLAAQASVLAEKLALQRAVDALEVALADETRAGRRARDARIEAEDALDAEKKTLGKVRAERDALAETVREVEARLADAEKRAVAEAKAAKREARKKAAGAESEVGELKARLVDMEKMAVEKKAEVERLQGEASEAQDKSREVQDELEKCRAELRRARQTTATTTTKVPTKKAVGPKKRRANEPSADDVDTPAKRGPKARGGFDASHVGEKSTFSITPFLNRTLTLANTTIGGDATITGTLPVFQFRGVDDGDDTTGQVVTDEVEHTPVEPTTSVTNTTATITADPPAQKKPRARPPKVRTTKTSTSTSTSTSTALVVSSPSKQNAAAPTATARRRKPARALQPPGLAQVVEEGEEGENRSPADMPPPKKRKLPAGTLETEAGPKKKKKVATATDKKTGPLGGAAVVLGPGMGGFAGSGGFSPLKRDRRGVNASFLA